jgi:NitT/TauT family transport system substrate-binding protein
VLTLAACGGSAAPASSPASVAAASSAAAKPSAAESVSAAAKPAASASPAAKPAAPASAAAGGGPVRISVSQNVIGNAPFWLAQQAGVLKQNGANVELQNINATIAIKQMVAGQSDGFIGGSPEALAATASGSPLVVVAVFTQVYDQVFVARKGIDKPEQVKGHNVGTPNRASVNGIATVAYLHQHGLEPGRDYTVLEIQSSGSGGGAGPYPVLLGAMNTGSVDAANLQVDYARKATQDGKFQILDDLTKDTTLKTAASSLTFQKSYVQQHPDQVQKSVDALMLGMKYFKDHPDEAKAVLKKTFSIDDAGDLETAYERDVATNAKDPTPRVELYTDVVAALTPIEPEVKSVDLNGIVDGRFVQDALKRGLSV